MDFDRAADEFTDSPIALLELALTKFGLPELRPELELGSESLLPMFGDVAKKSDGLDTGGKPGGAVNADGIGAADRLLLPPLLSLTVIPFTPVRPPRFIFFSGGNSSADASSPISLAKVFKEAAIGVLVNVIAIACAPPLSAVVTADCDCETVDVDDVTEVDRERFT